MLFAIRQPYRSVREKTLGATFLSGTTISTRLTELTRFLSIATASVGEQGIRTFDAWAAVSPEKSTIMRFFRYQRDYSKRAFPHLL